MKEKITQIIIVTITTMIQKVIQPHKFQFMKVEIQLNQFQKTVSTALIAVVVQVFIT